MANKPCFPPFWDMSPLKQTNHLIAGHYGSPAYASQDSPNLSNLPSPNTVKEMGSTSANNFNTNRASYTTALPTSQPSGSPYDPFQYSPQQHVVATPDNTYGCDLVQGTNTIMTPPPPSIAQQNQAMFDLLKRGTDPDRVLHYVENFKTMVSSGNLRDLAILAVVPTEELQRMIAHNASRLPYTIIESPPTTKRDSVDEDTAPHPQAAKRPRTSYKGKEPAQASITREGCPGDDWKCKPEQLKQGRKAWDTLKRFREHFEAEHLEGCRVEGHRWQCPLCDHPSFGGNGSELLKHLWHTHWV